MPGDTLLDDGSIEPDRTARCRHAVTFPNAADVSSSMPTMPLIATIWCRVSRARSPQQGLTTEIREPHLSPPCSRRRATLRAARSGNGVAIGFNAAKSHQIVDMHECHILRPELFALVAPLRTLLTGLIPSKRTVEITMTLADQGPDLLLKGV